MSENKVFWRSDYEEEKESKEGKIERELLDKLYKVFLEIKNKNTKYKIDIDIKVWIKKK